MRVAWTPFAPTGDERTPRDAVSDWVAAGLPEVAAHDRAVRDAVRAGPTRVDLSDAELAAVGASLDATVPSSVDASPAVKQAGEQSLRARGILIDGFGGFVLAPEYLATIGLVCWPGRSASAVWPSEDRPTDPGASHCLQFAAGGSRCAELRRLDDGWRISVTTLEQFVQELEGALGLGARAPASPHGFTLACHWKEIDDDLSLPQQAVVTMWPDPPGAGWEEALGWRGETSTSAHLSADEARAVIRKTLDRGSEDDRREEARAIAAAKLANRKWWHPVGGSTIGDAIFAAGLEWFWSDPKIDHRLIAHSERRRQQLASEYWAPPPAPVFVQRRSARR